MIRDLLADRGSRGVPRLDSGAQDSPVSVASVLLGEVVAEFLEEALAPGADLLVFDLGEFAEQLFLAGREVPGGLDDDLDELVAAAPAADVGHARALDPEDLAALGPSGTCSRSGPSSVGTSISAPRAAWAKLIGTWQNRSLRLRSKNGMLPDDDLDPQVAPRAPEVAELALVAELEPHAALDAGRDVDLELGDGVGPGPRPGSSGRGR